MAVSDCTMLPPVCGACVHVCVGECACELLSHGSDRHACLLAHLCIAYHIHTHTHTHTHNKHEPTHTINVGSMSQQIHPSASTKYACPYAFAAIQISTLACAYLHTHICIYTRAYTYIHTIVSSCRHQAITQQAQLICSQLLFAHFLFRRLSMLLHAESHSGWPFLQQNEFNTHQSAKTCRKTRSTSEMHCRASYKNVVQV
jgi:hypothetical protein